MARRNWLVEGVSGSGKTTLCDELNRRGWRAVHGDRVLAYQGDPETGEPRAGTRHEHHVWRLDAVRALVADREAPALFLCGGSRNWHRFLHLLDGAFVLRADEATMLERLARRGEDEWGGRPEERAMARRLWATGEDLPPGVAIDAMRPVGEVAEDVLGRCGLPGWVAP